MRRLAITVLTLLAATAASAPAASAATLTTDTSCYQETQEVVVTGAGFAPKSVVTLSRDKIVLGSAQTDANGGFRNKFDTPELPENVRERVHELSATDVATTAQTSYRSTRIFATFTPRTGNPSTLLVRFSINGFGLVKRGSTVYLHYVRPDGRVQRTVVLGKASGVCGKITRTAQRRLFPFRAAKGVWILQFDTRKRYERATSKRRTPWVRKPVEIFSRGR